MGGREEGNGEETPYVSMPPSVGRSFSKDEIQAAFGALDNGYARMFMRSMFNPINPFIGGAASAAAVVAAQSAWMQRTYEPLPHPSEDKSSGFIEYEGDDWSGRTRRVLVVGDSLVLGVGCDQVPKLAESLNSSISKHTRSSIAWRAYGLDGGDCRSIHRFILDEVLPGDGDSSEETAHRAAEELFHGDSRALRSEGGGRRPKVDACIVFCGLNDFKKLLKGRTAAVFGRDLRTFMLALRRKLGRECMIFLPAMPMEPTRFPEPLKSFVIFIGEIYDEEKNRVSKEHPRIVFIYKPHHSWWRGVCSRVGDVISADGVHPNDAGYEIYGEKLGLDISEHILSAPPLPIQH